MQLNVYADLTAFAALVRPALLEREAEHNLILGLLSELERDPLLFGAAPPYAAAATGGGAPAAVALMTPPHNLILAGGGAPEALALLADDLALRFPDLPGLLASAPVGAQFIPLWRDRRGAHARRTRAERIYELTEVSAPAPAPGRLRPAAPDDRALVAAWFAAFLREALDEDGSGADRLADRWLAGGPRALYLWEDGGPVAMAGVSGPTPNGIRISAVYTPPERRRRGYASACVAAVSQIQLDAGRRFCFLFTDLANPTSNHIYQAIGYRPVCDVDEWKFEAQSG